jgi:uncharacterized protein
MKRMTKQHLLSLLTSNQHHVQSFGVKKLGLFGSYVRNEAKATSDIDLLVEFEPGKKNFNNFVHLSFFLEELFQKKVELVTPESLSPYIGPNILAEVEYVAFNQ